MTIGRAPGSTLVLVRPVGLARARADLRTARCSRTRAPRTGRALDGVRVTGPVAAARRREDPARRRRAARSSAGATTPRRAGRSSCARARRCSMPAAGAASVTGSATQFGMKPRVRSGYALKRLDASEGAQRWVLKDLATGTLPAALRDNDARLFEQLDGVALAGRAGAALPSSASARPGRRGWRGCCPTWASAASSPAWPAAQPRGGGARRAGCSGCSSRARRSFTGHRRRASTRAVPPRRLGALHAAGADRPRGAGASRASRAFVVPDRRALRDAVRGREASSGSAALVFLLGRFARGRRARDRARADDGVVRAAGRPRRASS